MSKLIKNCKSCFISVHRLKRAMSVSSLKWTVSEWIIHFLKFFRVHFVLLNAPGNDQEFI